jgi:hypothetical protein
MLGFLKSLFARPKAPHVAVEISSFEELVGHHFSFHDDQTRALNLEVEVRAPVDGYLAVVTTRHSPAGPQQSSVFVNGKGTIASCPDFGEQYVGRQDCLWLPPALRQVGASGWVGMYPSQLKVVDQVLWRGVPVWRCEYKVFGDNSYICYDQSSGVKVGQHAIGYLAKCSLALTLPK